MKILLVSSAFYPLWGGTEIQARRQAVELARRGHQVTVLTWAKDEALLRTELIDGVLIRRVPRGEGNPLRGPIDLARMCATLLSEARDADVITVHQVLFLTYLTAIVGVCMGKPVVAKAAITASAADSDLGMLGGRGRRTAVARLLSLPLRRGAIAVAISAEIARDLQHLGFRRIVCIPNGVADPGVIDRAALRDRFFARIELDPQARVVVAAGRFVWWKGFGALVDAWPLVIERHPDRVLVLIGGGEMERELRSQVHDLGIEASVRFVPPVQDMSCYLAAADVVVIPSFYEGLSNVLLEAMMAGTPVIATAVSGNVDLIRDGENGRLVQAGDVAALAKAIGQTLSRPGSLGACGRQTALAICELSYVVDQYEAAFAKARTLPPGNYDGRMLVEPEWNWAGIGAR